MLQLKTTHSLPGRVIDLADDGGIIIGRHYDIFKYDQGKPLTLIARLPCPVLRRLIEPSRLLCRLLRHEIRGFLTLPDGSKVAASRQWLHWGGPNDILLSPARVSKSALAVKPPMTITSDSQGRILWGEYWSNADRREVRLFVSNDKGRSYEPFFEFKAGDVKHVHNIIEDLYDNCYWVFVGDHEKEPGIGRLSKDLKHFDWLVRGEQKYRAVTGFLFVDKIVYGTDTEKDFNGIYAVDKASGKTEKLCEMPGSCIYSTKFGNWYTVSTSVEYFEKYQNNLATLWVSQDALNWQQVYQVRKDIWSKKYFQFGSIVLPRGHYDSNRIVFSGQALKTIDNKVFVADIVQDD